MIVIPEPFSESLINSSIDIAVNGYNLPLAAFFSANVKCLSLSRISPQGDPCGFLPLSIPHFMLGFFGGHLP